MEFKKFEVEDVERLKNCYSFEGENSCENTWSNLFVWKNVYNNEFAEKDGFLFIRSRSSDEGATYRLPVGNDLKKGIEILRCSEIENPTFWAPDGKLFKEFKELYGDKYIYEENMDAADYIYKRENLAELKGKKYHSKRNHISAFSKKFDWRYERLNDRNIELILSCAERWYAENEERLDIYMKAEKEGFKTVLYNREKFGVTGGVILVEDEVVAFTAGSPINSKVFDIHIEKALSSFSEAYTVINREFAANELTAYEYINREDDMGLEGLRRAKLSYRPEYMLKKYFCRERMI